MQIKAVAYITTPNIVVSKIISKTYTISDGEIPSPDPTFTEAVTYFAEFNSKLYAGTKNTTTGAEVFLLEGSVFTKVLDPAALGWNGNYKYISSMYAFNGRLYVGVYNEVDGAEVWRTTDTSSTPYTWEKVYDNANPFNAVDAIIEYKGYILLGVSSYDTNGANHQKVHVYYSSTGNSGSFTNELTGGHTWGLHNNEIANFTIYNNELYIATIKDRTQFGDGCELFKYTGTPGSGSWTGLVDDSVGIRDGGIDGNNNNMGLPSFAEYGTYFYMGVKNVKAVPSDGKTPDTGCKIWRSDNLTNAGNYFEMVNNGFGDINNISVDSLIVFQGKLYALTRNYTTGTEMYSTTDGVSWTQVNTDGFGDATNVSGRAVIIYDNKLYIGLEKDSGQAGATVVYYSTAP